MKNSVLGIVTVVTLALLLALSTSKMNDELIKYVDTKIDFEINKLRNEQLKGSLQEIQRWKDWSERMMEKHRELTEFLMEENRKLRAKGVTKT